MKMIKGLRLQYLRREINKEKRASLAEEVGVDRATIGLWELGHKQPSYESLRQIAAIYNVSLDYLECREFWGLSDEELCRLTVEQVWRDPEQVPDEIYPADQTLWTN